MASYLLKLVFLFTLVSSFLAAPLRFRQRDATTPTPVATPAPTVTESALNLTAQQDSFTFDLGAVLDQANSAVYTLSQVPPSCAAYTPSECPTAYQAVNVTYDDCGSPFTVCYCPTANMTLDTAVQRLGQVPVGLRRFIGTVVVSPDVETHAYTLTSGDIHMFGDTAVNTWVHESAHAYDWASGTPYSESTEWSQAIGNDTCVPDTYSTTDVSEDFAQMTVMKVYAMIHNNSLPEGWTLSCMSHQMQYMSSLPVFENGLFGDTCAISGAESSYSRHSIAPIVTPTRVQPTYAAQTSTTAVATAVVAAAKGPVDNAASSLHLPLAAVFVGGGKEGDNFVSAAEIPSPALDDSEGFSRGSVLIHKAPRAMRRSFSSYSPISPLLPGAFMDNYSIAVTLLALSVLYVAPGLYKSWVDRRMLSSIPTVGESGILSSYISAYKYIYNARNMVQEGYKKYPGAAFKIPRISGWTVVVSGHQMIDEIRKASDENISFREAAVDDEINNTPLQLIQTQYTMGPEVRWDAFHVDVVKTSLTRSLAERFSHVQDEIVSAFNEYIPATEDWTPVRALPTIMKIVSRSSNRLFVGLPLCRDPDYRDLNITFTVDVAKAARIINLFPDFLKPLAGRYFTNVEPQIQRAIRHLRPIIEERIQKEAEYGKDWPGKPNDALSWLLDLAEGERRTVRNLTMRILVINFAAIHTTSMILYDLAANPSFVPALREEVEAVIAQDGYSKLSLHKMVKVDSFVKESQRLGGIGALSMQRKILKDFTFSDGTVIPRGHTIAVANYATHHDEGNYTDPFEFDGFRFSKLREAQGGGFSKHQMVALSNDYIVFGNGKHACQAFAVAVEAEISSSPGRFFAVNELKALLAHTVLNYDVSFENGGPRPADPWFGLQIVPDPKVAVMFRKRRS
ncbi:hypothetical protein H0H92_005985 [Tricholoma furcatifolium]|nr:hypothetical protein H0H92_005985 [Tricholoma furcatifolium]